LGKGLKFFYYCSTKQKEVVFFIPESEDKLIQACYELRHDKTREREISSLLAVMKETGIKESLMITLDEDEEIQRESFKITIIPAWKYFLTLHSGGL
jgi:hypothetical protein